MLCHNCQRQSSFSGYAAYFFWHGEFAACFGKFTPEKEESLFSIVMELACWKHWFGEIVGRVHIGAALCKCSRECSGLGTNKLVFRLLSCVIVYMMEFTWISTNMQLDTAFSVYLSNRPDIPEGYSTSVFLESGLNGFNWISWWFSAWIRPFGSTYFFE